MFDIKEARARLQRAIVRLEENRSGYFPSHQDYIRLGGKIEGVKLALSYLEEDR